MFVITANRGESFRNDRSLSSASATRYFAAPELGVAAERADPAADHGGGIEARPRRAPAQSSRSWSSCRARRRPRCPDAGCISSASISARGTTANPRSRGRDDLGVGRAHGRRIHHDLGVAHVAARHAPARCGRRAIASRSVMSVRCTSDPLTSYPRFTSSSAMPLMPMPPMPMKWIRLASPSTRSPRRDAPSNRDHRVHDVFRRARPGEPSGAADIRRAPLAIAAERDDALGQPLAASYRPAPSTRPRRRSPAPRAFCRW